MFLIHGLLVTNSLFKYSDSGSISRDLDCDESIGKSCLTSRAHSWFIKTKDISVSKNDNVNDQNLGRNR